MNFFASFGIGIISGIVTSLIVFAASAVFEKVFLPWYREVIYVGVSLSGKWRFAYSSSDKSDSDRYATVEIEQKGHHLSGSFTFKKQSSNTAQPEVVETKFTGVARDGYVIGKFESAKSDRVYYLSVLLKITEAGRRLEGQQMGRDTGSDEIKSSPVTWHRLD